MREIGSEFWQVNYQLAKSDNMNLFYSLGKDVKFLMSGRTAIDYIIQNIEDTKKIVYMPEYCCNSMVQPFFDNG